jgi:hypothetical protein
MNIIELVKKIIAEYPGIEALSAAVHTDYTEDDKENFGVYPTGDQLLKEDVCGNQDRQHSFILYAVFQGLEDYDRLTNSSFLLDLAYWLEHAAKKQVIEATINNKDVPGTLIKLSSANGMLYGYQTGALSGPVTYQLQIQAQYHLESEVL